MSTHMYTHAHPQPETTPHSDPKAVSYCLLHTFPPHPISGPADNPIQKTLTALVGPCGRWAPSQVTGPAWQQSSGSLLPFPPSQEPKWDHQHQTQSDSSPAFM